MIEKLNNFFKKIFINDETIVFSLMLIATLVVLNYFGSILTPFLVSIIVAYLLVGLQRKLESFGLRSLWALIAVSYTHLTLPTILLV